MSNWYQQEQERRDHRRRFEERCKELNIAEKLNAIAIPENRRAGKFEDAYNCPAELNEEIYQLYSEFFELKTRGFGSKPRYYWSDRVRLQGTPYMLDPYGRKADKFYIFRFTENETKQIHNALAEAIETIAEEERN